MKITKEFAPITIVIETHEEYLKLQEFLAKAQEGYMTEEYKLYAFGSNSRGKLKEVHDFKKKLGMQ